MAERADLLIERNHTLMAAAAAAQARSRVIVEDAAKRTLRARQMRLSWAQDRFGRALRLKPPTATSRVH